MPKPLGVALLLAALATPFASTGGGASTTGLPQIHRGFEENLGQWASAVRFRVRTGNGELLLGRAGEATFVAAGPGSQHAPLEWRLEGSNPDAVASGLDEIPGTINYLRGANRKGWRTGVRRFARVRYQDVYPGIDLVVRSADDVAPAAQNGPEMVFQLAAGSDPRRLILAFSGLDQLTIDLAGDIVLGTGDRTHRLRRPRAFQGASEISCRYVRQGKDRIGFAVGAWDHSRPLVIDPVLEFSTYLGGSGAEGSTTPKVALDALGNIYVAGTSNSTDLPTRSAYQAAPGGTWDVFVAKFDPQSAALVYLTYLGGTRSDYLGGITVDGTGNAYVCGETSSSDFPVRFAYQGTKSTGADAFLAKLGPTGSTLVFSTYLGADGLDGASDVALDAAGSIYVVGSTNSASFPTTPGVIGPTLSGGQDGFVAKFNAAGSALRYSTYLGGSGRDLIYGLALDAGGVAHVAGHTGSPNFPLTSAAQAAYGGGLSDGFAAKLSATATSLLFSTYLGGSGRDVASMIALGASGEVYVTGATDSDDFPTRLPFQATRAGLSDAFIAKLSPSGGIAYASYFGGTVEDEGTGVAVGAAGQAIIAGWTKSTDFPLHRPLQAVFGGGTSDSFLSAIDAAGNGLLFSTYVGGSQQEQWWGSVAAGRSACTFATLVGMTISTDFPLVRPTQAANAGVSDVFVRRYGCPALPGDMANALRAVRSGAGTALTFRWLDAADADSYRLDSGTDKTVMPTTAEGEVSVGDPGLTIADPIAALVLYRLAGVNCCGEGPR